jgi:hypothetical protein
MSPDDHDPNFSSSDNVVELTPKPKADDGDVGEQPSETQKDALIRLGSIAELWHDLDQKAFATLSVNGHRENHSLRSKPFKSWLRWLFYLETEKAPGSQAIEDALCILEAKAVFDGEERETYRRLAERDGRIYIDLGDEAWRAIEVTAAGWKVVDVVPVAFIRSRGMRPLSCPERGGSIKDLRKLVNIKSDGDFKLFVAWLLAALRPGGPYPVLCLNGEQGASKTTLARLARRLIDPNIADTRTMPKDETDLLVAARNGWIINLDNLSQVRDWLSDALCRIATGGGFGARQLYTDTDETLFEAKRPIVINGIPDLATRPDLADRSIVLILPPIEEREKISEKTFWRAFDQQMPKLLGVLLDAMCLALRDENDLRDQYEREGVKTPRMVDAAIWVDAAAPALTWNRGEIIKLLLENRVNIQKHIVDADLVGGAIQAFMKTRTEWKGYSTDLLKAVREVVSEEVRSQKDWPKAANNFTNKLRAAAPGIRMSGIEIVEGMTHGKTTWKLRKIK